MIFVQTGNNTSKWSNITVDDKNEFNHIVVKSVMVSTEHSIRVLMDNSLKL